MEDSKCSSCLYSHNFCVRLKQLPVHKEIKISKTKLPNLPLCFKKTLLGEAKGALKQFRGPCGIHILEYAENWVLHRDRVDPRIDPFGHLVKDAPHILAIGGLATFTGIALIIGFRRKRKKY